jgi:transaldolase/glucose-6-phosphate isomerase
MNKLKELNKHGQSVWLDYIRRSLITSGELGRLVENEGVTGVTINPTIFEKAIAGSDDYDEALQTLLKKEPHMDARKLYENLVVDDVQQTADILKPIYDVSKGKDGFVSLELSPSLSNDTSGSVEEARYFWNLVDRPNLLIKVPATPEGIPAIEQLISEGINVNITLMFSISHYDAVANAYLNGLEKNPNPSKIASVASFFISRVDTIVDRLLEEKGSAEALKLKGQIGISNSKVAYKKFSDIFSSPRWNKLKERGGRVQRVLWASTGTKNPEYSDVLYVEELIGRDTVNTMPPATMNAFKDHGRVQDTLEKDIEVANENLKKLDDLSISLNDLTEQLQSEGIVKFSDSYDKLINALDEKRSSILHGGVTNQVLELGKYQKIVDKRLKYLSDINFNRRLWEKDSTLWSKEGNPEITNKLGWLNLPEIMHEQLEDIISFAREIKAEGFKEVILLGMGGSSLAPEVFQNVFGNAKGYPKLKVLDSTHPDTIDALEREIEVSKTLFIVASKSGTTLETNVFFKYFWDKVNDATKNPGSHFIAISDPGSPLGDLAKKKGFRRVFLAQPDLGGRYSALTVFGLVPAALIGIEIHRLIDRAWASAEGCASCVKEYKAPGLILGASLGELALKGRNKITFFASPSLKSFTNWLEQLIAESTGKDMKGILPVVNDPLIHSSEYGNDRFFINFSLKGEKDVEIEKRNAYFESFEHPIIKIHLSDLYDIGLEIFRWETAIAVTGLIMGINPFNQPDVEIAKELARKAMKKVSDETSNHIETYNMIEKKALESAFAKWFSQAKKGEYIGIQAYLAPTNKTTHALHLLRTKLSKAANVVTTIGYGPRFLHSTGQLHKGGANTGLFLQLIDKPKIDLKVPLEKYTFGDIISAQAKGDYLALKKRNRRLLRVNLGQDTEAGILKIKDILT